MKFNIQDRLVLDEMIDTFIRHIVKQHDQFEKEGKRPIIMKNYWLQMIKEVQYKIDAFTLKKALNHSKKYK